MMKKLFQNAIVLLLLAVAVGMAGGLFIPEAGMKVVLLVKQVCGQHNVTGDGALTLIADTFAGGGRRPA